MAKVTIIVSPSTVSLQVGQTATLVASLANGVIIGATWSSSNKAKIHVNRDTGLVTALVASTETITATYRGGSSTCRVTALAAPVTDLTITCPGNQTVTGTGALTVVKLGPIQTSGGVAPIVVTFQPPIGSGFPIGTTVVTATAVSADGQRATCQYSVTVTGSFPPPPGPLAITCPVAVVAYSPDGNPMAVTFAATTTGGTAPVTITYTPASGSTFALGTTGVVATATSTDGQTAICSFSVTVNDASDSAQRGPLASIACLVGSFRIELGQSIQAAINAQSAGASFCLAAGTHTISASITPKSGNSFIGELGAIIDGTGWTSSDTTQAAFRAHNQDINNVTIRNLVIQNMPQCGVRASSPFPSPLAYSTAGADGWMVDHCEIANNLVGVVLGNTSILSNNYIHHNIGPTQASGHEAEWGAAYQGLLSTDTLIENNEISYNGSNQRFTYTRRCTVRNNFIHHNEYVGIWFDGENSETLLVGNRFEDQVFGFIGEVNGSAIIRSNTFNRHSDSGVFISTSHSVEVASNTFGANFRSLNVVVDVSRVGEAGGGLDTHYHQDISCHDNVVAVPNTASVLASVQNALNGDATPYSSGTKNITFTHNTYTASSTTGAYFYWYGATKTFLQWQALQQDTTGTIS